MHTDGSKPSSNLGPQNSASEEGHADEVNRADQARKAHIAKLVDTKIFVVWIESFEDALNFPAGKTEFSEIASQKRFNNLWPILSIFRQLNSLVQLSLA